MTTILVVDDSALDRNIAGACVEEQGLSAIYAQNGREALEVLERDKPEVVLTDLQMPEIDGLELVKRVRQGYSSVPVILMTAFGSEEVAAQALRAGAASYVPKKLLRETIGEALRAVMTGVEAATQRDRVRQFLLESESKFKLGYESDGPRALISYFQDGLRRLSFCDDVEVMRISTALTEAINNAIDHGNLQLDSALRDSGKYRQVGMDRAQQPPYCDRRVYVTSRLTESEVSFSVRDEGNGFDPSILPDPTDPENLTRVSGRGVMLIRTFMDEVNFNESGTEITMIKRRAES